MPGRHPHFAGVIIHRQPLAKFLVDDGEKFVDLRCLARRIIHLLIAEAGLSNPREMDEHGNKQRRAHGGLINHWHA